MTSMRRDQYLFTRSSRQIVFAIGQVSVFEGGVDGNLIVAVFQGQKSFVRQAESPIALIVRSTVRDPLRTIRKREQMRLQLAERHYCMHWHAVVHHVQIVMLKIYHPLP